MPWTTAELEAMSQAELDALLAHHSIQYHNFLHENGEVTKTHLLADRAFDHIVEIYEARFGRYTKVGAPAISSKRPWQRKYVAPVFLGSIDKITKREELELWNKKHPGKYVDSAKIDGCSLLYELPQGNKPAMLSTRGDEGVGVDMTHLLPFLNLPTVDTTGASVIAVRGELIILESDFAKLQKEWSDAGCDVLPDVRATVASLCTSQTIDLRAAKYAKFYGYCCYTKNYERFERPSRQFELIGQLGISRPWFRIRETTDFDELTATTIAFRPRSATADEEDEESEVAIPATVRPAVDAPLDYQTDGLVIAQDIEVAIPELGQNPSTVRAFKVQSECKETVVTHIEWVVKSNVINPKVHFEPVLVGTRWIKRANGKNASLMVENKVSVGARALVWFANSVIPDFEIIAPGPAHADSDVLPTHLDWEWNKSRKAIVLKNHADSDAAKKQRLERFFKHLKADGLGEANCLLMYERWNGNWLAILNAKPEDYHNAKKTNARSAQLLCEAVKACTRDVPLPRLMDASGCFGLGLGETKFKSVVAVYPDVMKWHIVDDVTAAAKTVIPVEQLPCPDAVVIGMSQAIERIQQVKLWQSLAPQFCTNLAVFQAFCNKHPMITWVLPKVSAAKVQASRKRKAGDDGEESVAADADGDASMSAAGTAAGSSTPKLTAAKRAKTETAPAAVSDAGSAEPLPSHIICTGFTFKGKLKEELEERGVDMTGKVSKKTKMLLVKEHGSGSSKEKDAHALGIDILTKDEFLARFHLIE